MPRFSVIVPTYRRPELLADALASVTAQTFRDIEVIVVDDDPDGSAADVVAGFARSSPGVTVTYLRNDHARGGSGTRNAGLDRARGEWIAFLDDDDTWLPDKLADVDALIAGSTDPDLVLVYTGHVKYDFERELEQPTPAPRVRGHVLERTLYENVVGGMSVVVAQTATLRAIGGLDERFQSLQDMELYVRMAERGTFDFVARPLVRIRSSYRERITYDPRKKLQGARLFAEKYAHLMRRSPRLRHRTASRTFVFSLAAKDYLGALKSTPWTLAGVMVDPRNVRYVVKSVARQLKTRGMGTTHAALR